MSCHILTKEATHGPESKQQTSDHEQSKKQIILYHMLSNVVICFHSAKTISLLLVCIGTAFPFLSNAIRVKNQFKENYKMSKTRKEATEENKNDIADGHKMYSTWFGHDVIHFRRCCGMTKLVLQDPTKVNYPMKLDSSLHQDCILWIQLYHN